MTSLNAVFDHDAEDLGAEELEDAGLLDGHPAGDASDGVQNSREGEGEG